MKKITLFLFLITTTANAQINTQSKATAQCEAYVPVFKWNFYGYPIDLSTAIENLLIKKHYVIQYEPHNPDFILNLNVDVKDGSIFKHAISEYSFETGDGNLIRKNIFTKRCITQLCAITDFPKPVEKMLEDLDQNMPACN